MFLVRLNFAVLLAKAPVWSIFLQNKNFTPTNNNDSTVCCVSDGLCCMVFCINVHLRRQQIEIFQYLYCIVSRMF